MRVPFARMSWQQKAELWRRWRHGESVTEIARGLDRVPPTSASRRPSADERCGF